MVVDFDFEAIKNADLDEVEKESLIAEILYYRDMSKGAQSDFYRDIVRLFDANRITKEEARDMLVSGYAPKLTYWSNGTREWINDERQRCPTPSEDVDHISKDELIQEFIRARKTAEEQIELNTIEFAEYLFNNNRLTRKEALSVLENRELPYLDEWDNGVNE